MRTLTIFLLVLAAGCPPNTHGAGTRVKVTNTTAASTVVYVSFGADSVIKAADWAAFCTATGLLDCHFTLEHGSRDLPNPKGAYLNLTVSFDGFGCGATKAEANVNNPKWFDVLDVSLVDGYSNNITMTYTPPGADAGTVTLGPPVGKDGNEQVFGVFPYGCDLCVERQNPPCGIAKGTAGCKAGTQYDPKPPCQYQGAVKGGGGVVEIIL